MRWQWYCITMGAAVLVCCTPRTHQTVLLRMMPAQEDYFRHTIIRSYEEQASCSVTVETYQSTDSIEQALAGASGPVSVVKIPFDKASSLLRNGRLLPLDSFLSSQEIDRFKDGYLMTSVGSVDGRPCLIPRKFETRIMVYRKSRVHDALTVWSRYKAAVDSFLSDCNGLGLPVTYTLEDDPDLWDYYDIFMLGWVWAHTLYDDTLKPRIGFRGKRYSGTSQRLYDRIYQLGGDSGSIVTMKGDAVVDAFYWEALYSAAGIYNSRMWSEGWSGADVWKAFGSNDVFLSFMTQLDCFFIHGTGSDNLNGYLDDPDDMGVATMPQACSVAIDATGVPLRKGSKGITTGGWWWGIPADAPDPRAAFELISNITGTQAQIQEASRFGMIPVRRDILGDMVVMFGGGWISGVYDVSFRQLVANSYTVLPANRNFNEINRTYLDMIEEILVRKQWSSEPGLPDRNYIASVIRTKYYPRLQALVEP